MNTLYLGDCLEILNDDIPNLLQRNITLKAAQLKGKKKKNQIKLEM